MKKIGILIIFSFLSTFCFAQIRTQVCIVRPNYDESLIEDLYDFAPQLSKLGVEKPEEEIDLFVKEGISGSGFIYVAPDGKNYIITNRHVIADAKTSTVIFQDEDGEEDKKIEGLNIFAANADLDIAILSFPDDQRPFKTGLQISEKKLHDGDTVYSAGFPGLLGNPSWQFGTGVVTNSVAKVPEMINPEYSSVIQHSAQIDAGNSGGPLLIKNEEGVFEVAGINAWKISNRQDANFSIPAKTVKKFIDDALAGNNLLTKSPEEGILEQAEQLRLKLNRFSATYEDLIAYISIEFIQQEGKAIFDFVYKNCNEENRQTLKEILVNYSPIMCMRFATGWYIFNEYHKNEKNIKKDQKCSVPEDQLPKIKTPVKYEDSGVWYSIFELKNPKNVIKSEWKYTNGGWELYSLKNISSKDIELKNTRLGEESKPNKFFKRKADKINTYTFDDNSKRRNPEGKKIYTPNLVTVGGVLPIKINTGDISFGLDVEINMDDWIALDFATFIANNRTHVYYVGEKYSVIDNVDVFGGAQLQLPFTGVNVALMPYVTGQVGIRFGTGKVFNFNPMLRGEGGIRFSDFLFKNGRFNTFLDLCAQVEMDFNKFTPDLSICFSAGVSY